MKIAAVALAAAFGGGIVLGLQPQIASHINPGLFVIPAILRVAAVVCLAYKAMNPHTTAACGAPDGSYQSKTIQRRPKKKTAPRVRQARRMRAAMGRLGGVDAPDDY